ncbi:MAG: hypothetical protein ABSG11_21430 [Candidatus Korobacteraceae bacterium]
MAQFDKLKKIAALLLSNLMATDLDLLVYERVFEAMKEARYPVPDMKELLEDGRKKGSPLRAMILKKYAETVQGLQQFSETDADKELLAFLESWKPDGPAN